MLLGAEFKDCISVFFILYIWPSYIFVLFIFLPWSATSIRHWRNVDSPRICQLMSEGWINCYLELSVAALRLDVVGSKRHPVTRSEKRLLCVPYTSELGIDAIELLCMLSFSFQAWQLLYAHCIHMKEIWIHFSLKS